MAAGAQAPAVPEARPRRRAWTRPAMSTRAFTDIRSALYPICAGNQAHVVRRCSGARIRAPADRPSAGPPPRRRARAAPPAAPRGGCRGRRSGRTRAGRPGVTGQGCSQQRTSVEAGGPQARLACPRARRSSRGPRSRSCARRRAARRPPRRRAARKRVDVALAAALGDSRPPGRARRTGARRALVVGDPVEDRVREGGVDGLVERELGEVWLEDGRALAGEGLAGVLDHRRAPSRPPRRAHRAAGRAAARSRGRCRSRRRAPSRGRAAAAASSTGLGHLHLRVGDAVVAGRVPVACVMPAPS